LKEDIMIPLENINSIEQLKEEYGDKLPLHLGIILDGNRRWIKRKGMKETIKGHLAGYNNLKDIIHSIYSVGIKYLSIYALSTENAAKRSPKEINYLYKLLIKGIGDVLNEPLIKKKKVKVQILGHIEDLSKKIIEKIEIINDYTKDFEDYYLNACILYDGQEEIVDAVKKIVKLGIPNEKITKKVIKENLYTYNLPEADYIIRTGMEDGARISGFLLWDSSYAEFRFRRELWPDYNQKMLLEDLKEYIRRNRRKGS